ncbi:MAG: 3-deoxy-D-manno-octulosonic acid transferase [Bacteroidia bacterium]|nr:3-deoxy-D-manno-octulosonic acid transferase [Bacteroidia bacterium]
MKLLYPLFMYLMNVGIRIASRFSDKAKKFVDGRKGLMNRIQKEFAGKNQPVVWVHCASLGEFEQGRPVIERIKAEYPETKILLTFFSPSGYEVQKRFALADFVCYLPVDSKRNARRFVSIVRPSLVIYVKYEFWYYFTREIARAKIPLICISSIFRSSQPFFQSYGNFFREILSFFSFFFVQNDQSLKLLKSIGLTNTQRAGDTRFDRVNQLSKQGNHIAIAKEFKGDDKLMVVGSCWPEDAEVLIPFINDHYYQMKFIIAPHEIKREFLDELEGGLHVKTVRYSQALTTPNLDAYQVLIIDNVGMLSRLYRYGEYAFVGGAFGRGLHNILEAACYGVPIFFGNKHYEKFQEAVDLINRGGAFEVADYPDLKVKYALINEPQSFLLACEVTRLYVEENLGATEKIMAYCRKFLDV